MAVKKTKKRKSVYFGWGNERRAELFTCSRIKPLSIHRDRRAWVLWGSKQWAVSRLSRLSPRLQSVCVNSPFLHAQSYAFITPYWTAMVSVSARPHALSHVSNNHCSATLSFYSCGLEPAARKFLSAPPTSVASEQLFSAAGQIYSDRRNSLLEENAEKLLFLAHNIRLNFWF